MTVLDLLRDGGYTLYARHAQATADADQTHIDFTDCRTQRNLSTYGRIQARKYGDVLRALQVPLEYPVITSPFCRSIETTALAFGELSFEIDPFWANAYLLSAALPQDAYRSILNAIDDELEAMPVQGRNRVIVAHSFPPGVALGALADMETVILKPYGRGIGYQVVGRLTLDEFMQIVWL